MDGYEYEHLVAKYLKGHGYTGVEVTKASGDFGVDVIARKGHHKYAVQCKYYKNPVGLSAIQQAVAGKSFYNCDTAMVVTNSTFTKAAIKLARANNVILLSGVRSAESRRFKDLPLLIKILLLAIYTFSVVAIFIAMINVVKDMPFWKAFYTAAIPMAAITAPVWIKPASRGIKALFRCIATKFKKQKESNAYTTNQVYADKEMVKEVLALCWVEPSDESIDALIRTRYISTSLVQRCFRIPYMSAAEVVDTLKQYELLNRVNGEYAQYEWTINAAANAEQWLNR